LISRFPVMLHLFFRFPTVSISLIVDYANLRLFHHPA
jgi:hypothetical protein